jgi:SAM-dependent methyltransferase
MSGQQTHQQDGAGLVTTTVSQDSQGACQPVASPCGEITEVANLGFEPVYSSGHPEKLPWHWAGLDPDVALALQKLNITGGRIVDLGAGAGTQAVALAERGFKAWATDFSSAAMRCAASLATEKGVSVTCVVDDVCNTRLQESFDLVLDRGCFHVVPPAQRPAYLSSLAKILPVGGLLLLKCFSVAEPPRPGPFRFSEKEVLEYFGTGYERIDGWDTEFHGTRQPHPRAIFVILRRVS